MCEEVRKSDHRPVICEFVLKEEEGKETQWFRESYNQPLHLRMTDFQMEFGSDKITAVKVCCPLPCEDIIWDERLVLFVLILHL